MFFIPLEVGVHLLSELILSVVVVRFVFAYVVYVSVYLDVKGYLQIELNLFLFLLLIRALHYLNHLCPGYFPL